MNTHVHSAVRSDHAWFHGSAARQRQNTSEMSSSHITSGGMFITYRADTCVHVRTLSGCLGITL